MTEKNRRERNAKISKSHPRKVSYGRPTQRNVPRSVREGYHHLLQLLLQYPETYMSPPFLSIRRTILIGTPAWVNGVRPKQSMEYPASRGKNVIVWIKIISKQRCVRYLLFYFVSLRRIWRKIFAPASRPKKANFTAAGHGLAVPESPHTGDKWRGKRGASAGGGSASNAADSRN